MVAKIITIFNSKGGVGKTTCAMNIAGTLGRRGSKVLLVDMDRQGTASRWFSYAPEEKEFPATITNLSHCGATVHREVRKHVPDYDYIVIDCPPAIDSPAPSSALLISDLAIAPFVPSVPDMWAIEDLSELVDRAKITNEALQVRLLATQKIRSAVGAKVIETLEEKLPTVPLMETSLRQLSAYREAVGMGGTVHDVPRGGQAVEEIEKIVDECLAIMAGEGR